MRNPSRSHLSQIFDFSKNSQKSEKQNSGNLSPYLDYLDSNTQFPHDFITFTFIN